MTKMTFWQLRCFVVLARELHFSRAAAIVGISQPTLSSHIRALERSLGAPLLHRTSREVTLSAAGRVLRTQAEQILAQVEAAERQVRLTAGGGSGKLHIGTIPSAAAALMPKVLRPLHDEMPSVDVQIDEVSTIDQVHRLAQGTLDIGLLHQEHAPKNVRLARLYQEPYRVFVGASHALGGASRLTCQELQGYPLIMWPRESAPMLYDRLTTITGAGTSPTIEVPNGASERAYAAAGLGLLVRPASWPVQAEHIRSVPLTDGPRARIYAAWRHPCDNPITTRVLAMLTTIAESIDEPDDPSGGDGGPGGTGREGDR